MLIALDSIEPWWTFMVFFAIVEIMITSQLYGLHGSGLNKTVHSTTEYKRCRQVSPHEAVFSVRNAR